MNKIKLSDKILPVFYEAWKKIKDNCILHVVFKGGRGSSKSTTIAIAIVMRRMKMKTNALCVRKVGLTLRKSCRTQIIWAIYHLGVQEYWKWSEAASGDMTMMYVPTGTQIFFEGADGDKIKGWKTTPIPTTDVWFEELAEFKDEEHISSIEKSILRQILPDGLSYKFFKSYNPPKRRTSWVNKKYETQFLPKNVYIHHSDYTTNKFLPNEFYEEAETERLSNLKKYEWEYLGKPTGSGIVPFENLVFRKITNEEIKSFDNIRQGCDWGYGVDPFSHVRMHYDKTRKKLYFIGEIYGVKLSNRHVAEQLKQNGWNDTEIIADSAEPKSIAEMKTYGIKIKGAKKGPGSVEYGEKWLDDLEEIIIDPDRCPNVAREYESIDYEVDRDGNPLARLSGKDNHTIDATRYGCEDDMTNKGKWGW